MTPTEIRTALDAARRKVMDAVAAADAKDQSILAPLAEADRILHEIEDSLIEDMSAVPKQP
jgi:hypothetical protein